MKILAFSFHRILSFSHTFRDFPIRGRIDPTTRLTFFWDSKGIGLTSTSSDQSNISLSSDSDIAETEDLNESERLSRSRNITAKRKRVRNKSIARSFFSNMTRSLVSLYA